MPLAEHIPQAPNLGWFIGLGIGFGVVVVVVAVLAALITFASRISDQTQEALGYLERSAGEGSSTSDVDDPADSARALLEAARLSRPVIERSER